MKNLLCLLVDDDPEDRKIFAIAVNEIAPGTQCIFAADGVEALRMLMDGKNHPDYIFLDVNMPRMSGEEFLAIVKQDGTLKEIPVVVHTTTARPAELKQLMKLGALGIHTKENDYPSVCKMLSMYLPDRNFANHSK